MGCPVCGGDRLLDDGTCAACEARAATRLPGTPTPAGDATRLPVEDVTHLSAPPHPATPSSHTSLAHGASGALSPGQAFGARYRILRVLGAGGMGTVYEAWDAEVDQAVALKLIRPETTVDPAVALDAERRFRRELVLARQVTHKNVIRIHDIGDVGGVHYLTMPFLSGEDLSTLLRREGRLPVHRVLAIAKQVARGLAAAHDAGVVHRDLKPANIMIDAEGTAVIMDFGIARSVASEGTATKLGSIIGTIDYMAPEQAQGRPVDQRADIYALGLILYDLLTDRSRLKKHDSAMSELMDRLTKPMPPVRTGDPGLSAPVAAVIDRCLKTDPAARYQTTSALLHDLEALDEDGHVAQAPSPTHRAKRIAIVSAAAVALIGLAVTGTWYVMGSRARPVAAPPPPVSVLVADFENKADEPNFDGLIEQALGVGLEGASFVSIYPRREALRIASQIGPGSRLDAVHAVLVAQREGIQRVVAGAIERQASGYRLVARAVDPNDSRILFSLETQSRSKDKVLDAVGQMAAKVRRQFGDPKVTPDAPNVAETFTAGSLDAAHAYVDGQQLQWAGKSEEALAAYKRAVALDPAFGRAYAGMGALNANLGRREEAEAYYKQAMEHLDRMTDREKYRTRGGYYLLVRNAEKAREENEALVAQFPADSVGLSNLALAEFTRRKFARAVTLCQQALAMMPRNVVRASNLALYELYAGDFAAAERQAKAVQAVNPEYPRSFVALGLSQLALGRDADARQTYEALKALPGQAKYFAAIALADLAMYQGRLADAAGTLEAEIRAEAKESASRQARLIVTLAEVREMQGRQADAIALAKRAMGLSSDERVQFLAGRLLAAAGQDTAAAAVLKTLNAHLEGDPQTYARLIEAEMALQKGAHREALALFEAAQRITDSWQGRFGLARTYLAAGSFAEADPELERCLKRTGEATAVLLDDIPSYRVLAPVHYYEGRVREALKTPDADAAYRTYLAIKANGDEQGLVADARRRLEKH